MPQKKRLIVPVFFYLSIFCLVEVKMLLQFTYRFQISAFTFVF